MAKQPSSRSKSTPSLRQRAEAAARASRTAIATMNRDDVLRLVDELQVHQIELELQNEELRHAQAELAQSHDRFNDLYDFAPVGYLTLDQDGAVLEANLTAATMLGVARSRLVAGKFTRFVARASQDTLYQHLRAALGGKARQTCELRLQGPGRANFFARLETVPFLDPAAGRRHCRCAIIDITERRQAEEELARSHAELERRVIERTAELRESERMARAVVDGLSAHIAIVETDGRILAVNERWRGFAKDNDAALISVCEGANYLAVCDNAARRKSPGAAAVAAGIRAVLAGRTAQFVAEYPCHSPVEERWFIARVTRFPGEGPTRVVIAHENITDRVKAEQAVRRERDFSERVIDTVQTTVLLLSPEGRILRFNRYFEELTGWPIEAVRGGDWFELFIPQRDRARIRRLFRRALQGRGAAGNVNPIVTRDGREVEIEWHDTRLTGADGRVVGLLCSGRDITERQRAEAALRASEERYRQLVQGLPVAVFTCDTAGRLQLYNAAAVALWGREPDRSRDRWGCAHRIFTPDGRRIARAQRPMAVAAREGEPIRDVELIIERPDGSRSHVLSFPDPLRDSAGAVIGAVNILVDITALKVAENELRTSERKLRTLSHAVEQSPASVIITNPAGEIEYVNASFTATTGYSALEVLGKNPRLLKSGEQPAEVFAQMWRTIAEGRDWRGEFCNRRKNGELFWEFAVIAPIRDGRGAVTHYVALKEDITERRRATAALAASEERLRAILNTVADAIITIDRRGTITGVNPAGERIFGYAAAELVGQNVRLLMPSPFREEHDRDFDDFRRTGQARIIGSGREVRALRKDGTEFPVELAVSEVEHLHMFTGVIRDISRRKRLEAEVLRIGADERQRVAADLHDGICQEMVGIQYLAIMLLRDLEKARHPLAAQARRIEAAIIATTQHSRDLARGLSPVVADGSGLMHALRQLAETTSQARRIRCSFECPAPVAIENPTTANELYRIAQEAILNAVRHGRAKRIVVRFMQTDGEACLSVADNGCGLPPDVETSAGMGLRVMRYRANLIGARLEIRPRRRGGTEVVCRLPAPYSDP